MNKFTYDGRVGYAVSFLLGALAIGAVEAWERSVAPAAVAPFAANRSSLVVQVSTAGCRLQNIVKRRGATDDRPALRTALYTWQPATRTRLPGGSTDTAPEGQTMEALREVTRSPSLLHVLQPTAGTAVTCGNTIGA